ncbi:hypothetical protein GCM10007940_11980 [Portibacter lacus]|uniref:Uncharacterized protein n=1 Tax=Portibacter lacus TaxID=1099794 RepID=A0AA37SLA0_9BACT|nr:hypothetical protein GCM10007940_11980 [Portibacter lacus]
MHAQIGPKKIIKKDLVKKERPVESDIKPSFMKTECEIYLDELKKLMLGMIKAPVGSRVNLSTLYPKAGIIRNWSTSQYGNYNLMTFNNSVEGWTESSSPVTSLQDPVQFKAQIHNISFFFENSELLCGFSFDAGDYSNVVKVDDIFYMNSPVSNVDTFMKVKYADGSHKIIRFSVSECFDPRCSLPERPYQFIQD